MRPDPYYEYSGAITFTLTPRYYRRHPAMHGFQYVFAATRLTNGKYLAFIGALRSPIPTCLPYSSTPSDSLTVLSRQR
jgi:hypothetical protein